MSAAAPRILCQAGPSLSNLQPVEVNRSSVHVSSPLFEGNVFVRLKDYRGPVSTKGEDEGSNANPPEDVPFSGDKDTWSIAFEGRVKKELDVDQILFGNTWEKPIKDYLPYGTSAALRFVKYVDPTLSCDLYGDKPWALSPLFSTLQYLSVERTSDSTEVPQSFVPHPMPEDTSTLIPSGTDPSVVSTPSKRRSYFASEPVRQQTVVGPTDLIRGDFSHGFLDFATLSLSLPGGLSFSLAKYWNGEPVTFSCRERGASGQPLFVVTFELLDEQGNRLGSVKEGVKGTKANEEQSDDVD
ncbi:hypothetical protein JCM10212_001230 [Sporobolomyces blumeae]